MRNVDDRPGHLARRFQQIAVSLFQEEAEAVGCDLTPVQFAALDAIARHPDIDQVTLSGLIALDRTTATGVIDRLERKGLVARTVSSVDRRARTLEITEEGRETLATITPAVEATQQALLSGLDPVEATHLLALLSKAIEALNHRSRAPLRPAKRD